MGHILLELLVFRSLSLVDYRLRNLLCNKVAPVLLNMAEPYIPYPKNGIHGGYPTEISNLDNVPITNDITFSGGSSTNGITLSRRSSIHSRDVAVLEYASRVLTYGLPKQRAKNALFHSTPTPKAYVVALGGRWMQLGGATYLPQWLRNIVQLPLSNRSIASRWWYRSNTYRISPPFNVSI